jgi:rRNA-processing protein FCF1
VALALYFDHNVHGEIPIQLRRRNVTVVTAHQDGHARADDPVLLDRATALGCVLVTSDEDFLIEAARRQRAGIPFAGVIYCHQRDLAIGQRVADLEVLAAASDPEQIANQIWYLPL